MHDTYDPDEISLEDLLTPWFILQRRRAGGIRRDLITQVEQHLFECIETDGHAAVDVYDQLRIDRERDLWPDQPIARIVQSDALPRVLCRFISPTWLMNDQAARQVQLQLVWRMLEGMIAADHADWSAAALFALRGDLDRVRSRIRAAV